MPTVFGTPLITFDPALPGTLVLDSSSNTINDVSGLDVSGDFAVTEEINVYNYTYTDVSGVVFTFTLTDTIRWDVNDYVVYKRVTLTGDAGPFGNQITAQITALTDIYDTTSDDEIRDEINSYLKTIQASSLYGMGTLSDYTDLLAIANDISGSISLDIDISGLIQLANAAQQYGDLFYNIEQKIADVTTVQSDILLGKIRDELAKIAQMYDNLEALKLTVERTSTLKISSDIQTTADKLDLAYTQISQSLNFLKYFVNPNDPTIAEGTAALAAMNDYDKSTISAAKGALNLFSTLVAGQQSTITESNNTQVKNLKTNVYKFSSLVADMTSVRTTLASALEAVGGIVGINP